MFGTKAEVLSVVNGEGWSARYEQDGEQPSWTFSPVVAFLILRHTNGRIETVGIVNDERDIAKGQRADKWPNFDGYTRS